KTLTEERNSSNAVMLWLLSHRKIPPLPEAFDGACPLLSPLGLLLSEGPDRALRKRDTLCSSHCRSRRPACQRRLSPLVAGRQDTGSSRCGPQPDHSGDHHHHRISRSPL